MYAYYLYRYHIAVWTMQCQNHSPSTIAHHETHPPGPYRYPFSGASADSVAQAPGSSAVICLAAVLEPFCASTRLRGAQLEIGLAGKAQTGDSAGWIPCCLSTMVRAMWLQQCPEVHQRWVAAAVVALLAWWRKPVQSV